MPKEGRSAERDVAGQPDRVITDGQRPSPTDGVDLGDGCIQLVERSDLDQRGASHIDPRFSVILPWNQNHRVFYGPIEHSTT